MLNSLTDTTARGMGDCALETSGMHRHATHSEAIRSLFIVATNLNCQTRPQGQLFTQYSSNSNIVVTKRQQPARYPPAGPQKIPVLILKLRPKVEIRKNRSDMKRRVRGQISLTNHLDHYIELANTL